MLELIKNISSKSDLASVVASAANEVRVLPSETVVGVVKGSAPSADSILVVTHFDTARFVCSDIASDGTTCASLIGTLNEEHVIAKSSRGVSAVAVKKTASETVSYRLDVGASDKADAKRLVSVGDEFVPEVNITRLNNNRYSGFGMSVYAPVAAMIGAIRVLAKSRPRSTVYFAFTNEGMCDFRQYASIAGSLKVDYAVCVGALDVEGSTAEVGDGAVVRLCDRSFASDKPTSDALVAAGAVPVVLSKGTCAASKVQVFGTPSAQLDIPVKYISTAHEIISEDDIFKLSEVIAEFCGAVNPKIERVIKTEAPETEKVVEKPFVSSVKFRETAESESVKSSGTFSVPSNDLL